MVEIKHLFADEVLHVLPVDTLAGADLTGAVLAVAELGGADLQGATLAGASLAVANLADANLDGCDLRGADLTGAVLARARLAGADLRGANLTGADLGHAVLDGADLGAANCGGANLTGAGLGGARLHGTNFAGACLNYANVAGAEYDDHTHFPALFFDPESVGAVRTPAPMPAEPFTDLAARPAAGPDLRGASWDAADRVLECVAQRAADATLNLSVRTAAGWQAVPRPSESLASQLQHAVGSAGGEARVYRDGADLGLIIRVRGGPG